MHLISLHSHFMFVLPFLSNLLLSHHYFVRSFLLVLASFPSFHELVLDGCEFDVVVVAHAVDFLQVVGLHRLGLPHGSVLLLAHEVHEALETHALVKGPLVVALEALQLHLLLVQLDLSRLQLELAAQALFFESFVLSLNMLDLL